MAKRNSPRHGSLGFTRNRVDRPYPRVRAWVGEGIRGFAAYKIGMTHIHIFDDVKNSVTYGETVSIPVTVLEVPDLTVYGIKGYKKTSYGFKTAVEILADKMDKKVGRKMKMPKKPKKAELPLDLDKYSILVHTNPTFKKTPELLEISVSDPAKAKELLGKAIKVTDVFKNGDYFDSVAITTGKGFQGTVKRFGVHLLSHKSHKGSRGPGNYGPWHPAKSSWRVGREGQMGFQKRTEYNKRILKIGTNPEEINPKGGFIKYGIAKKDYLLVKGSIQGTKRRLICMRKAIRLPKKIYPVQEITYISKESQQGA